MSGTPKSIMEMEMEMEKGSALTEKLVIHKQVTTRIRHKVASKSRRVLIGRMQSSGLSRGACIMHVSPVDGRRMRLERAESSKRRHLPMSTIHLFPSNPLT